jgi:hypothetical protein
LSDLPTSAVETDEPGDALLDICIVGGGIAGGVAALRAQELGLSVQLVEASNVFHACTSDGLSTSAEPESSAIAWARSHNPSGLTAASLDAWKNDLLQREIPVLEGARVFAIDREDSGCFCARLSEPGVGGERRVRSRAILIATGAPNVLEASGGSAQSLGLWLAASVERAALVVGAGADAISFLVDVSEAKAQAETSAPVYWCAGVEGVISEASPDIDVDALAGLSEKFLAATLHNLNIRSLPPAVSLVPSAQGDTQVLTVAEPAVGSAAQIEQVFSFDDDCVFRFGVQAEHGVKHHREETPSQRSGWELLSGLSVRVERQDDQSLLVLDAGGRLSHAGLYAAGAVRGNEYLLCAGFDDVSSSGSPSGPRYERVRRSDAAAFSANEAIASVDAIALALGRSPTDEKQETDPPIGHADKEERYHLIRLNFDGSIGARFELTNDITEIGRSGCDIEEPDDSHMADHHASVVIETGEVFVADSGQGSGVWLRVDTPDGIELENQDQIWLGAQILVATRNEETWTVVHYGQDGIVRETYTVGDEGIFVGRGSGHVLDPNDGLLSRRHAQFCIEGGKLKVYDRGGRNGTFVKVNGATEIHVGAEFRVSARGYRLERSAGPAAPGRTQTASD